jgi:hypothetical protein
MHIKINESDMLGHAYNPSTQEAETILGVQGQPGLHSKIVSKKPHMHTHTHTHTHTQSSGFLFL